MKRHHMIEIFSSNCPLCRDVTDDIEIGKCQGCEHIIYNINNMTEGLKTKMKDYGLKAVPTTHPICSLSFSDSRILFEK